MNFPLYLLMISYGRQSYALSVIRDFLNAQKPPSKTRFIVVENSKNPNLNKKILFSEFPDIVYCHFQDKNKAAAINFAIKELIEEEEAVIIAIDNDIRFNVDYLLKYYNAALKKGRRFYFGSSFHVKYPFEFDQRLIPFLSGSAIGQPDEQFLKMERLMFLGFSYAFFKSQWKRVGGLDERFSPGSRFNLAAEESIFQKKLINAGFVPFFVKKNSVQHRTMKELYLEKNVAARQKNNGYTHGFQDLVSSSNVLKLDCLKKLAYLIWKSVVIFLEDDRIAFRMKSAYTKGYFNAFLLYLRIKDKSHFLNIQD